MLRTRQPRPSSARRCHPHRELHLRSLRPDQRRNRRTRGRPQHHQAHHPHRARAQHRRRHQAPTRLPRPAAQPGHHARRRDHRPRRQVPLPHDHHQRPWPAREPDLRRRQRQPAEPDRPEQPHHRLELRRLGPQGQREPCGRHLHHLGLAQLHRQLPERRGGRGHHAELVGQRPDHRAQRSSSPTCSAAPCSRAAGASTARAS